MTCYYTYAPRSCYPANSVETVKDAVFYTVRVVGALTLSEIKCYVPRWFPESRNVSEHTIRARISELVASGYLIRLIDARYAHDEAMRQSEREMRRIRKGNGLGV